MINTLDGSAFIQSTYLETSARSLTYLEATKDRLVQVNFGLVGNSSSGYQMLVSQNVSANAGIDLNSSKVNKQLSIILLKSDQRTSPPLAALPIHVNPIPL